jgi:hypothetical protein
MISIPAATPLLRSNHISQFRSFNIFRQLRKKVKNDKNQLMLQKVSFKIFLVFILAYLSTSVFAQKNPLKGIVIDAETGDPLAFVNITVNDSLYFGSTDIDGRFSLQFPGFAKTARFSFVGYEALEISDLKQKSLRSVKLQPKAIQLDEVVVRPGLNPAHRIIQNAINNKNLNDPKKLKSFKYTTYDKMVISADTLEAENELDGLKVFVAKRDIMVMETVSERSFKSPDKFFDKVIATKISGLKDPIVVFLLSQLHTTDFYDESIRISGKLYVNPLSRGSIEKYLYVLEEISPTRTGDTIFTISYRPRIKTNFDGLKGVVSIHSDRWAIQNVIASSALEESNFGISIQQLYEKADSTHWFPSQLNTEISFRNIGPIKGYARSYLRNIEINPEIDDRLFSNIVLEVEKDAFNQNSEFWANHRIDSLNSRLTETYRYMDSLGKAVQLDRLVRTTTALINGLIPLGMVDLNIRQLLTFNDFEGFKPGLGLQTNQKLSRHFAAAAFFGYALKRKQSAYEVSLNVPLWRKNDWKLQLKHYQNHNESGSSALPENNPALLNESNFRRYFIDRMDFTKGFETHIHFMPFKKISIETGFLQKDIFTDYGYQFKPEDTSPIEVEKIFSKELRLSMGYTPREKFTSYDGIKTPLVKVLPVFWITYSLGNAHFIDKNEKYQKFELRLDKSWHFNYTGKTNVRIEAGIIDGTLPYQMLFNLPASYSSTGLYATNSFATMRLDEFVTDRYIQLFFVQDFGQLLVRKKFFNPEISFATNISFGWLKNSGQHTGIEIKSPEDGFFESGILLKKLIKMPGTKLGVGAFYRYGPYQLDRFKENLALKLTISIGLQDF